MNKFLLAAAATLAMTAGQSALADVDVGISIGIPGFVYPAPGYYYEPPPRYVRRPRVVVVPEAVYVPGPRWVWSDRGHGYYRAVPPGHRGGKHWKKHRRGHGDWDD
ncbi:virulence factor [Castellaniella sp. GW247-6E4]|uniref:virulence factor n=1 Tax=Castellaniella sp. GW247-6E4 TaxID=3140380 RepID=UPI0033163303